MLLYCTPNKKPRTQVLVNASIGGDEDAQIMKPKTTTPTKDNKGRAQNQETKTVSTKVPTPQAKTTACDSDTNNQTNNDVIKTSNKPRRTDQRHVRFDSVELKEYAVTIGDFGFDCKGGYFPLTLDWSHTRPKELSVREYEADKARRRHTSATSKWEFHMDTRERWERLRLVSGFSESTLAYLEQNRQRRQL